MKIKDKIWNYLIEFNEGRRTWEGGSLTSWDKPIIKENKDEDDTLDIEQEEDEAEEEEEEKTFRDIVKKDEKRLGEEIDELSRDSKFNETAGKIYSLVDSYFNPPKGQNRQTPIEDLFVILKRFSGTDILKISKIWQLIEKIVNTRYLIKRLFQVMEIEDDEKKNDKLLSTKISNEEYQELKNNLNSDTIKTILLKRKDNIE